MNTKDLKDILAIAAEERRIASVRCLERIDALAKEWESRADECECDLRGPIGAEELACTLRQCAKEMRLRANSESASTDKLTDRR
jgi:hypothetical protein